MTKATNTNTTIATDPILAAIEAHKAAIVALDLSLSIGTRLWIASCRLKNASRR